MHSTRVVIAERACVTVLLLWLAWLPLPFGSVVERARVPLIAVPLALCAVAAAVRLYTTRDRNFSAQATPSAKIWLSGGALFLLIAALQLVPLPMPLLRVLSPASHAIWSGADGIATLAGAAKGAMHPLTVDPAATAYELFRVAAILAAFAAAAMLVRTHVHRVALACTLCGAALFEVIYGLREAALQRYEIWGWVNRLIFDRTTGTFVNPNHFAHYLAIILPLPLFMIAVAWHRNSPPDAPFARRLAAMLEGNLLLPGFSMVTAAACVAAMLLAQSRGALLALVSGILAVAALLPGKRVARVAFSAAAAVALLVTLVLYLGPERTVARFVPNQVERETFVGRRVGIAAALAAWQRFPLLGSGLGTFERVVSMEQSRDLGKVYHHAHNDYAEIAATSGTIGFAVAMLTLLAGAAALVRMTFGREAAKDLRFRRRAFQAAALAGLAIAMVHALFDFNSFIPSNPATLAAILGAAVASVDHDRRTRR